MEESKERSHFIYGGCWVPGIPPARTLPGASLRVSNVSQVVGLRLGFEPTKA